MDMIVKFGKGFKAQGGGWDGAVAEDKTWLGQLTHYTQI